MSTDCGTKRRDALSFRQLFAPIYENYQETIIEYPIAADVSFLMTGSSTRKLRRGHANLLAGRALWYTMTPLSYIETDGFDLEDVFISGLLPFHFTSTDPVQDLRSYVAEHLKEEIAAEAVTLNISAFTGRFFQVVRYRSPQPWSWPDYS